MRIELNYTDEKQVKRFITFLENITSALGAEQELSYKRACNIYGEGNVKKIGITGLAIDVTTVGNVKHDPTAFGGWDLTPSIINLYVEKFNKAN